MILDVGPQSIAAVTAFITGCRTIVWNGPMGTFEISPFDTGTNAVAQAVAARTVAGELLSVPVAVIPWPPEMPEVVTNSPIYQPLVARFWNVEGKTCPVSRRCRSSASCQTHGGWHPRG